MLTMATFGCLISFLWGQDSHTLLPLDRLIDPVKQKDRQAILAMAGTYEVTFHFEETAAFLPGYELKPAYDAKAFEEVIVVAAEENHIVLQHVLKTKYGMLKHWRQDWLFENRELLEFQGDRRWRKRELSAEQVRGTWTQRVFQVDDSPRYESYGTWFHVNGFSQWESAPTARPLPRREYSKRDDYDVLVARNRHALTPNGWVHEQDNYKLKLATEDHQVIAREMGLNTYQKQDPEKGQEIREWWQARAHVWRDVRAAWHHVFEEHQDLTLFTRNDDGPMYRAVFDLSDRWLEKGDYDAALLKAEMESLIGTFRPKADQEKSLLSGVSQAYGGRP